MFLPAAEEDPISGSHIASKRRGYRSSSRWRKKDGLEVNGDELSSEEDEEEGLERKLARLRREFAEVKGEVERQNSEREKRKKEEEDTEKDEDKKEGDGKDGKEDVEKGTVQDKKKGVKKEVKNKQEWITGDYVDALGEVLNSVASTAGIEGPSAATKFAKRLALALPSTPQTDASTAQPQAPSNMSQSTTYTLTYAPTYNQNHTLSQISSFDTRLSTLESLLGIDTLPLPTQLSSSPTPKPLLPTLNILSDQLTTLTTAISSPSALDTLTRRVRALTTETQSLEAARKIAAPAPSQEDTSDGTSTPTEPTQADPLHHSDTLTKLNALHALLPTITSLAPLLPPTLDRLRSLRTLHAEAATASQTLRQVEERQEAASEEVKAWRAGLEGVERKVAEAGERWEANAQVVEGWAKELEGRMEA